MRRVVSLLHRQAVRAKAEGLFFKESTAILTGPAFRTLLIVPQSSTLHLFKSILADQTSLPRDQPYKDLVALINFILRQFFKAIEKDAFLAIEVDMPSESWNKFLKHGCVDVLSEESGPLEAILELATRTTN